MNVTSLIFFGALGLVVLWILSSYFPGLSTFFSSLMNSAKSTTKEVEHTVEFHDKTPEKVDGDMEKTESQKLVEITDHYVQLWDLLEKDGNEEALSKLQDVFSSLNLKLAKVKVKTTETPTA